MPATACCASDTSPSPPTATSVCRPSPTARAASAAASSAVAPTSSSTCAPPARRRSTTGPALRPARPLPALGLTRTATRLAMLHRTGPVRAGRRSSSTTAGWGSPGGRRVAVRGVPTLTPGLERGRRSWRTATRPSRSSRPCCGGRPRSCRSGAGPSSASPAAPAPARRPWRRRSSRACRRRRRTAARRTGSPTCRWTATTSPTWSWPGSGGRSARAHRTPSTQTATPRCWRACTAAGTRWCTHRPSTGRSSSRSPAASRCSPSTRLVVTEGNYLLLDQGGWARVRRHLDEVWYCDLDDEERRSRLVARHTRFGKEPAHAVRWVADVDEPNARLVRTTRDRADLVVTSSVLRALGRPPS